MCQMKQILKLDKDDLREYRKHWAHTQCPVPLWVYIPVLPAWMHEMELKIFPQLNYEEISSVCGLQRKHTSVG